MMMQPNVLEICAFSLQGAISAQAAGADRIELCENASDGGTTPSFGTIKTVRANLQIPLYPIIRPRGLNYFYSKLEWKAMMEDLLICKNLACDGVSIGVQNAKGALDYARMKQAVEMAYPMGVTCNRVFDQVSNQTETLEALIDLGVERILTSGGGSQASNNTERLATLVQKADYRIIIMPGAGVRSENIAQLKASTGANEFHASARLIAENSIKVNQSVIDNGQFWDVNVGEIRALKSALM